MWRSGRHGYVATALVVLACAWYVLCGSIPVGAATRSAHFAEPIAIAFDGAHVWVANVFGNSVTEIDTTSGSVLRVIDARADDFVTPIALAVSDSHVWIVNEGVRGDRRGTGSITELNANSGALIRVIKVRAAHFDNPAAIAIGGRHVWVSNLETSSAGGSITDIDERRGSITRVVSSLGDYFDGPVAIAAQGNDVWIVSSGVKNYYGNGQGVGSVTELNATTGTVVRIITAQDVPFDEPSAIVVRGNHVWVANLDYSSIVELNSSNGSLVRFIQANSLNEPLSMTVDRSHLWVANFLGNSVTELNTSNGEVVRVVGAGINAPGGIVCDGAHVWVTNGPNDSVTELSETTGSLIRTIK